MTKIRPDYQATVLSTSQPDRMDDLIDRLRNPLWVHSPVAFDGPQLEQEENLAAMNEAADKLAALAATPAVGGEVVSYRWRPHGGTNWIYDPTQQWLLAQNWNEIEVQPLYTAHPASPLRGRESVREIAHRHCTCTCRGDPEVLQNHTNLCDEISDAILEYAALSFAPIEQSAAATPATLICYDDEDREHRFECANGFVSRVVSTVFHSDNMGCYSDARRVMEIMNDEASR